MKTKLLYILISLLAFSGDVYSNPQGSVYLSLQDYKNNKLTNELDCHNGGKIHLHNIPWSLPYLTVITDKGKYKYEKKDLYGYKDCDNNIYKLYKNEAYKIAEAGNIYIHTQTENITQTKGFIVVNVYYFSKGPDGEIVYLSFSNLNKVFASNIKFRELMDDYSQAVPVTTYDNVRRMYKVNYLYSKATNDKQ